MKRRALPLALVGSLMIAGPVVAAPTKDGGCPGRYETATYAEVAQEFPELVELYGGTAGFEAGLMGFDKNSNGTVCWTYFPSTARVYDKFLFHALIIDDNAVGLAD